MQLSQKVRHVLTSAIELFLTDYPGTVDELVIVREQQGAKTPYLPYFVFPARDDEEGHDYEGDARKVLESIRQSKTQPKRLQMFSVPDAEGIHFDAAVFLGQGYILFINSKEKTLDEMKRNPKWSEVEKELGRIISQLGLIYSARV